MDDLTELGTFKSTSQTKTIQAIYTNAKCLEILKNFTNPNWSKKYYEFPGQP